LILYVVHRTYSGDSNPPMENILGVYTTAEAAINRALEINRKTYDGDCNVTAIKADEPLDPPGGY
jgi:hypothetical protein